MKNIDGHEILVVTPLHVYSYIITHPFSSMSLRH